MGSLDPTVGDPLRTLRVHRSPSIADPSALFADELGSIWWVNAATATIGHLRADAPDEIESHDLRATAPGSPRAWASDGVGRLWVTAREPAGLVSFEPADPVGSAHRVGHPDLVAPDGIWLGGDGALWIADTEANRIVRHHPLATGDPWSFHGHPPEVAGPFDIKGDGGDHLWFTNKATGTIGRIECGGRGG